MTQFQVSHDGAAYRVYATEFGVDRRYFREMFANPRAAIAFADSPMTASPEYESRSREGEAVIEAPDPVLAASAASVAPSRAVPPVAREGLLF